MSIPERELVGNNTLVKYLFIELTQGKAALLAQLQENKLDENYSLTSDTREHMNVQFQDNHVLVPHIAKILLIDPSNKYNDSFDVITISNVFQLLYYFSSNLLVGDIFDFDDNTRDLIQTLTKRPLEKFALTEYETHYTELIMEDVARNILQILLNSLSKAKTEDSNYTIDLSLISYISFMYHTGVIRLSLYVIELITNTLYTYYTKSFLALFMDLELSEADEDNLKLDKAIIQELKAEQVFGNNPEAYELLKNPITFTVLENLFNHFIIANYGKKDNEWRENFDSQVRAVLILGLNHHNYRVNTVRSPGVRSFKSIHKVGEDEDEGRQLKQSQIAMFQNVMELPKVTMDTLQSSYDGDLDTLAAQLKKRASGERVVIDEGDIKKLHNALLNHKAYKFSLLWLTSNSVIKKKLVHDMLVPISLCTSMHSLVSPGVGAVVRCICSGYNNGIIQCSLAINMAPGGAESHAQAQYNLNERVQITTIKVLLNNTSLDYIQGTIFIGCANGTIKLIDFITTLFNSNTKFSVSYEDNSAKQAITSSAIVKELEGKSVLYSCNDGNIRRLTFGGNTMTTYSKNEIIVPMNQSLKSGDKYEGIRLGETFDTLHEHDEYRIAAPKSKDELVEPEINSILESKSAIKFIACSDLVQDEHGHQIFILVVAHMKKIMLYKVDDSLSPVHGYTHDVSHEITCLNISNDGRYICIGTREEVVCIDTSETRRNTNKAKDHHIADQVVIEKYARLKDFKFHGDIATNATAADDSNEVDKWGVRIDSYPDNYVEQAYCTTCEIVDIDERYKTPYIILGYSDGIMIFSRFFQGPLPSAFDPRDAAVTDDSKEARELEQSQDNEILNVMNMHEQSVTSMFLDATTPEVEYGATILCSVSADTSIVQYLNKKSNQRWQFHEFFTTLETPDEQVVTAQRVHSCNYYRSITSANLETQLCLDLFVDVTFHELNANSKHTMDRLKVLFSSQFNIYTVNHICHAMLDYLIFSNNTFKELLYTKLTSIVDDMFLSSTTSLQNSKKINNIFLFNLLQLLLDNFILIEGNFQYIYCYIVNILPLIKKNDNLLICFIAILLKFLRSDIFYNESILSTLLDSSIGTLDNGPDLHVAICVKTIIISLYKFVQNPAQINTRKLTKVEEQMVKDKVVDITTAEIAEQLDLDPLNLFLLAKNYDLLQYLRTETESLSITFDNLINGNLATADTEHDSTVITKFMLVNLLEIRNTYPLPITCNIRGDIPFISQRAQYFDYLSTSVFEQLSPSIRLMLQYPLDVYHMTHGTLGQLFREISESILDGSRTYPGQDKYLEVLNFLIPQIAQLNPDPGNYTKAVFNNNVNILLLAKHIQSSSSLLDSSSRSYNLLHDCEKREVVRFLDYHTPQVLDEVTEHLQDVVFLELPITKAHKEGAFTLCSHWLNKCAITPVARYKDRRGSRSSFAPTWELQVVYNIIYIISRTTDGIIGFLNANSNNISILLNHLLTEFKMAYNNKSDYEIFLDVLTSILKEKYPEFYDTIYDATSNCIIYKTTEDLIKLFRIIYTEKIYNVLYKHTLFLMMHLINSFLLPAICPNTNILQSRLKMEMKKVCTFLLTTELYNIKGYSYTAANNKSFYTDFEKTELETRLSPHVNCLLVKMAREPKLWELFNSTLYELILLNPSEFMTATYQPILAVIDETPLVAKLKASAAENMLLIFFILNRNRTFFTYYNLVCADFGVDNMFVDYLSTYQKLDATVKKDHADVFADITIYDSDDMIAINAELLRQYQDEFYPAYTVTVSDATGLFSLKQRFSKELQNRKMIMNEDFFSSIVRYSKSKVKNELEFYTFLFPDFDITKRNDDNLWLIGQFMHTCHPSITVLLAQFHDYKQFIDDFAELINTLTDNLRIDDLLETSQEAIKDRLVAPLNFDKSNNALTYNKAFTMLSSLRTASPSVELYGGSKSKSLILTGGANIFSLSDIYNFTKFLRVLFKSTIYSQFVQAIELNIMYILSLYIKHISDKEVFVNKLQEYVVIGDELKDELSLYDFFMVLLSNPHKLKIFTKDESLNSSDNKFLKNLNKLLVTIKWVYENYSDIFKVQVRSYNEKVLRSQYIPYFNMMDNPEFMYLVLAAFYYSYDILLTSTVLRPLVVKQQNERYVRLLQQQKKRVELLEDDITQLNEKVYRFELAMTRNKSTDGKILVHKLFSKTSELNKMYCTILGAFIKKKYYDYDTLPPCSLPYNFNFFYNACINGRTMKPNLSTEQAKSPESIARYELSRGEKHAILRGLAEISYGLYQEGSNIAVDVNVDIPGYACLLEALDYKQLVRGTVGTTWLEERLQALQKAHRDMEKLADTGSLKPGLQERFDKGDFDNFQASKFTDPVISTEEIKAKASVLGRQLRRENVYNIRVEKETDERMGLRDLQALLVDFNIYNIRGTRTKRKIATKTEVQQKFNDVDTDDTGKLDSTKFAELLEQLDEQMSEEEAIKAFAAANIKQTATITLEDFYAWYTKLATSGITSEVYSFMGHNESCLTHLFDKTDVEGKHTVKSLFDVSYITEHDLWFLLLQLDTIIYGYWNISTLSQVSPISVLTGEVVDAPLIAAIRSFYVSIDKPLGMAQNGLFTRKSPNPSVYELVSQHNPWLMDVFNNSFSLLQIQELQKLLDTDISSAVSIAIRLNIANPTLLSRNDPLPAKALYLLELLSSQTKFEHVNKQLQNIVSQQDGPSSAVVPVPHNITYLRDTYAIKCLSLSIGTQFVSYVFLQVDHFDYEYKGQFEIYTDTVFIPHANDVFVPAISERIKHHVELFCTKYNISDYAELFPSDDITVKELLLFIFGGNPSEFDNASRARFDTFGKYLVMIARPYFTTCGSSNLLLGQNVSKPNNLLLGEDGSDPVGFTGFYLGNEPGMINPTTATNPSSLTHAVDGYKNNVKQALSGQSVVIFGYGASGAGKTYTIFGTRGEVLVLGLLQEMIVYLFLQNAFISIKRIFDIYGYCNMLPIDGKNECDYLDLEHTLIVSGNTEDAEFHRNNGYFSFEESRKADKVKYESLFGYSIPGPDHREELVGNLFEPELINDHPNTKSHLNQHNKYKYVELEEDEIKSDQPIRLDDLNELQEYAVDISNFNQEDGELLGKDPVCFDALPLFNASDDDKLLERIACQTQYDPDGKGPCDEVFFMHAQLMSKKDDSEWFYHSDTDYFDANQDDSDHRDELSQEIDAAIASETHPVGVIPFTTTKLFGNKKEFKKMMEMYTKSIVASVNAISEEDKEFKDKNLYKHNFLPRVVATLLVYQSVCVDSMDLNRRTVQFKSDTEEVSHATKPMRVAATMNNEESSRAALVQSFQVKTLPFYNDAQIADVTKVALKGTINLADTAGAEQIDLLTQSVLPGRHPGIADNAGMPFEMTKQQYDTSAELFTELVLSFHLGTMDYLVQDSVIKERNKSFSYTPYLDKARSEQETEHLKGGPTRSLAADKSILQLYTADLQRTGPIAFNGVEGRLPNKNKKEHALRIFGELQGKMSLLQVKNLLDTGQIDSEICKNLVEELLLPVSQTLYAKGDMNKKKQVTEKNPIARKYVRASLLIPQCAFLRFAYQYNKIFEGILGKVLDNSKDLFNNVFHSLDGEKIVLDCMIRSPSAELSIFNIFNNILNILLWLICNIHYIASEYESEIAGGEEPAYYIPLTDIIKLFILEMGDIRLMYEKAKKYLVDLEELHKMQQSDSNYIIFTYERDNDLHMLLILCNLLATKSQVMVKTPTTGHPRQVFTMTDEDVMAVTDGEDNKEFISAYENTLEKFARLLKNVNQSDLLKLCKVESLLVNFYMKDSVVYMSRIDMLFKRTLNESGFIAGTITEMANVFSYAKTYSLSSAQSEPYDILAKNKITVMSPILPLAYTLTINSLQAWHMLRTVATENSGKRIKGLASAIATTLQNMTGPPWTLVDVTQNPNKEFYRRLEQFINRNGYKSAFYKWISKFNLRVTKHGLTTTKEAIELFSAKDRNNLELVTAAFTFIQKNTVDKLIDVLDPKNATAYERLLGSANQLDRVKYLLNQQNCLNLLAEWAWQHQYAYLASVKAVGDFAFYTPSLLTNNDRIDDMVNLVSNDATEICPSLVGSLFIYMQMCAMVKQSCTKFGMFFVVRPEGFGHNKVRSYMGVKQTIAIATKLAASYDTNIGETFEVLEKTIKLDKKGKK